MSKQDFRPPPAVVESIKEHAAAVREEAKELTKRIEQFEAYLATVKGRMDTTHFGRHPDCDPEEDLDLAIRLHRSGKEWVLSWANHNSGYHEEHAMDWQLLKEAPLKIKIAAVQMFPDFLEEIEKSQIRLAKEIRRATTEFDEFIKKLPLNEKERE